jgi:hypothetical protein
MLWRAQISRSELRIFCRVTYRRRLVAAPASATSVSSASGRITGGTTVAGGGAIVSTGGGDIAICRTVSANGTEADRQISSKLDVSVSVLPDGVVAVVDPDLPSASVAAKAVIAAAASAYFRWLRILLSHLPAPQRPSDPVQHDCAYSSMSSVVS